MDPRPIIPHTTHPSRPDPTPEDFTACLWDAATGAHQRTLHGGCGAVGALAFSGDSRVLALGGGERGRAREGNAAQQRCITESSGWERGLEG